MSRFFLVFSFLLFSTGSLFSQVEEDEVIFEDIPDEEGNLFVVSAAEKEAQEEVDILIDYVFDFRDTENKRYQQIYRKVYDDALKHTSSITKLYIIDEDLNDEYRNSILGFLKVESDDWRKEEETVIMIIEFKEQIMVNYQIELSNDLKK